MTNSMAATNEEIKNMVRAKYGEIAGTEPSASSCCCVKRRTCCENGVSKLMADDYQELDGYNPDADLGLGCGLPTAFAQIRAGDTVLDLGSGAGNDCFVARTLAGSSGRVIGVDFTPSMIERARQNAARRGFTNIEFVQGDIEALPLEDNLIDVVVSNCVLNLVPNKPAVFAEILRVLKPGGHFSISDIVLEGELPDQVRSAAELYAGCISGAMQMDEYLALIPQAGFINVQVQKKKPIIVPESVMAGHLSKQQYDDFQASGTGIFSITVFAEKPATKQS